MNTGTQYVANGHVVATWPLQAAQTLNVLAVLAGLTLSGGLLGGRWRQLRVFMRPNLTSTTWTTQACLALLWFDTWCVRTGL